MPNTLKILYILLACGFNCIDTFAQNIDEYTLKAVWLGKFTQFIDWPSEKVKSSEFFIIGLYKSDPFNGKLDSIYKNQTLQGKPVKIIMYTKPDSIGAAHVLFIPKSAEKHTELLIKKSNNCGLLLVGDNISNAAKGLHLNFFMSDNRLKFEINETAINASGFFVSFRLLNIAKIIQPID